MRTSSVTWYGAQCSLTYFDAQCYMQERNLINVQGLAGSLTLTSGSISATYAPAADGSLTIDVSDLVRMQNTGTLTLTDGQTPLVIDWQVVGRISQSAMVVPDYIGQPFAFGDTDKIVMPCKIIETMGLDLSFEMGARPPFDITARTSSGSGIAYPVYDGAHTMKYSSVDGRLIFALLYQRISAGHIRTMQFEQRKCGRRYVTLRWIGRLGGVCQLVWEARDFTYGVNESVSIENVKNEYDVRKGQAWSFTARLDGLTDYDYWYYSSIVTSSDVRAAFGRDMVRVNVETKDVTTPSGNIGKLHTLEIKISWKKYDTI